MALAPPDPRSLEGQLRTRALAFPEATEDFPWGERAIKVRRKARKCMTGRAIILAALAAATIANRASSQNSADWTEPFPPFRIAGNLYYVGSKGLANYLIATPQGHILINSDLEANVPLIRASVEKLGFKFADIKFLLISHAHWDHNAGSAAIKALTGAKYLVMDADVP